MYEITLRHNIIFLYASKMLLQQKMHFLRAGVGLMQSSKVTPITESCAYYNLLISATRSLNTQIGIIFLFSLTMLSSYA